MPKLPATFVGAGRINELIERQRTAWKGENFADALAANGLLRATLAEAARDPAPYQAQAEIDHALILSRLSRKAEATRLMKRLEADGALDALLQPFKLAGHARMNWGAPYHDYFLLIQYTYLKWLRDARDPALPAAMDRAIARMEQVRSPNFSFVGQTGLNAKLIELAVERGDMARAQQLCSRHLDWLKTISPTSLRKKDLKITIAADHEYVYDWLFCTISTLGELYYSFAEEHDVCAMVAERNGDGASAIESRRAANAAIVRAEMPEWLGLLEMRTGRLLEMLGRGDEAARHLRNAWERTGTAAEVTSNRALICERLGFTWKGKLLTPTKVLGRWSLNPATADVAGLYDCASFAWKGKKSS